MRRTISHCLVERTNRGNRGDILKSTMTPDSSDIEFSRNKYVQYHIGQSNIILSVPHGGSLRPVSIPNRDAGALVDGKCVYSHKHKSKKDPDKYPVKYKKDMNTIELAEGLMQELQRLSGKRPHLIINNLYRGKMDPNVECDQGSFGVPAAVDAWTAYHSFIETAQNSIHSPGLLLDIHGHVHSEDWIELGYTLSGSNLNARNYTPEMTSVYSLYQHSAAGVKDITDLIIGDVSLGRLLSTEGYKVVPSPQYTSPGNGHYYTGGYITRTHGSKHGGHIDAIQVESPSSLRSKENVGSFAQVLGRVVHEYVMLHYQ